MIHTKKQSLRSRRAEEKYRKKLAATRIPGREILTDSGRIRIFLYTTVFLRPMDRIWYVEERISDRIV